MRWKKWSEITLARFKETAGLLVINAKEVCDLGLWKSLQSYILQ